MQYLCSRNEIATMKTRFIPKLFNNYYDLLRKIKLVAVDNQNNDKIKNSVYNHIK